VPQRLVIAALLGALLSGAGAWITWGRSVLNANEIKEIVKTQSPYVVDKKAIEQRTKENTEELKKLREEIKELSGDSKEIKALLKFLTAQMRRIERKLEEQ
jgi:DNA-binding transcriptional MerR regulator